MKTYENLAFESIKKVNNKLSDEFHLHDSDIQQEDCNIMKLLVIRFTDVEWKTKLSALHTYFTESAPYEYNGFGLKMVKNYSSSKMYSSKGEEDLHEPKQKLLKFFLQDGTFIFCKRNDVEQCQKVLISVNGNETDSLDKKTKVVEMQLLEFIHTFEF